MSLPTGLRESLAPGRVKGSMIRAHLEWLREHHPPATQTEVLARLPQEVALEATTALATTWCSFESLIRLDREIARVTDRDEAELMRELGRHSARVNLGTVYRAFRRDDIHEFFRRSAALHRQFQDFCSSEYVSSGATGGVVSLAGATCFSPVYCASAVGYYEEVIRIHGGAAANVTETSCQCAGDEACAYALRWR
jgi:hypothetical protein